MLTRINAKEFRRYHAAILYVYRCILGKPKHAKIHGASDLDVVAELAAIAPRYLISIARVALYSRLLVAEFWPALAALAADTSQWSWLTALERDLHWFSTCSGKLAEFRGLPLSAWTEFLTGKRSVVRRTLVAAAVEQTQIAVAQARLASSTVPAGAAPASYASSPCLNRLSLACFTCSQCGDTFNEYQPLAVHMANKHGTKRAARLYARADRTCTSCLLVFSTRARLVDHLAEKNPVCMLTAAWHTTPLSVDEAAHLDRRAALLEKTTAASGRRFSFSPTPVSQALGPLQRLIVPPNSSRQSRTLSLRFAIKDAIEWDVFAFGPMPMGRVDDELAVLDMQLAVGEDDGGDPGSGTEALVGRQLEAEIDDDNIPLSELFFA